MHRQYSTDFLIVVKLMKAPAINIARVTKDTSNTEALEVSAQNWTLNGGIDTGPGELAQSIAHYRTALFPILGPTQTQELRKRRRD